MRCPYCHHDDAKVVDSREVHDSRVIRRRRECGECARRFTTYERLEDVPAMIVKKDGRRERFDRQKLLRGLLRACEKRPVAVAELEAIAAAIETSLLERTDRELACQDVGSAVMARLKELDRALRYSSSESSSSLLRKRPKVS